MSKLLLPLNLPLKVRGIKGGYFHNFHNSPACQRICSAGRPCPSYLKRGKFGKIDKIRLLRWQNRLVL